MDKYDAVVVGLGNIGARFSNPETDHPFNHSAALVQNSRIRLIGGADPFQENREYFSSNYGLPAYSSLEELLGLHPTVASICSPSSLHYEHVMTCLQAGVKMIWLEKPPVETTEELRKIQSMAQVCGASILVNFQRRYCENYEAVRNLFANGHFGAPVAGHIFYSRGLEQNGSHMLDALFFISGDQRNIELNSVSWMTGGDNPSFVFSTNGFPATVSGLDLPYHCVEIVVFFEKIRVSIKYSGLGSLVDVVVENEYAPGYYRLKEGDVNVQLPVADMNNMLATAALDDLICAYEENQDPVSSLMTARQTLELIELIRAAD